MGFEKLAELKKQLTEAAKDEASQSRKQQKPSRPNKGTPVDPILFAIGRLQKLYPQAFPKNPAPKVALKIGIFEDLIAKSEETGLSGEEIKKAIQTWCRSKRYWASIVEGANRVDLEGKPAGVVTTNEAAQARHLEKRRSPGRKIKPASPPSASDTSSSPALSTSLPSTPA